MNVIDFIFDTFSLFCKTTFRPQPMSMFITQTVLKLRFLEYKQASRKDLVVQEGRTKKRDTIRVFTYMRICKLITRTQTFSIR